MILRRKRLRKGIYETGRKQRGRKQSGKKQCGKKQSGGKQCGETRANKIAAAALHAAPVKIEQHFSTPVEHHPMEPHATIAIRENNNLTLHDSTQAVTGSQKYFAAVLGIDEKNVRVIAQFIGGGRGAKSRASGQTRFNAAANGRIGRASRAHRAAFRRRG